MGECSGVVCGVKARGGGGGDGVVVRGDQYSRRDAVLGDGVS